MSINPIDLINSLNLNNDYSFDILKNKFYSNLYTILEDDNLFMISENENIPVKSITELDRDLNKFFTNYISHIFTKNKFKYITSFPKVSYTNNLAKIYLKNNQDKWDEFTIAQSFEGPYVQLFFYNKWYISTNKNLESKNIYGNCNKCIRDYFIDTGKCTTQDIDKLNKEHCYHFIILHNKLKHIVQYTNLGHDYKEIALVNITKSGIYGNKFTEFNTEVCISQSIKFEDFQFLKPMIYHFSCFDEMEATLDKITYDNAVFKRISTEGFIIKHKTKTQIVFLKLQTEIYCQIDKLKPLTQNNYQTYLELYQHDKLNDILPYISKYSNEIIHRINLSMRTLSREILNIYHTTRKKKNCDLYDCLSDSYKKILYGIHGLYIKGRRKDFINGKEIEGKDTRSITVHDIYYYIKNLPIDQLKQLYLDRLDFMNNMIIIPYLNLNCIYTLTQSRLMST